MLTINSLSGGKTSSYLAVHYPADHNIFSLICIDDVKCQPKDKKLIQMVNDKLEKYGYVKKYGEFIGTAEDDKVLQVMFDLEQMISKEIVWVRSKSFEEVINKKGMLPNVGMRYCTTELKIIPIAEWIINNLPLPVFCNLGIRYDELERQKVSKEDRELRNKIIVGVHENGNNKWEEYFWGINNYPLIHDRIFHHDIQEYWETKEINFQSDSNCVGCFWKDVQQLRKNWDNQKNKMQWFSDQEKRRKHFFKAGFKYEQIKKIGIQQEFNFGTGSGCQAGFCTD